MLSFFDIVRQKSLFPQISFLDVVLIEKFVLFSLWKKVRKNNFIWSEDSISFFTSPNFSSIYLSHFTVLNWWIQKLQFFLSERSFNNSFLFFWFFFCIFIGEMSPFFLVVCENIFKGYRRFVVKKEKCCQTCIKNIKIDTLGWIIYKQTRSFDFTRDISEKYWL